jgi:hypothetical protein
MMEKKRDCAETSGLAAQVLCAAAELNRLVGEAVQAGFVVRISKVGVSTLGTVEHHIVQVSVHTPG